MADDDEYEAGALSALFASEKAKTKSSSLSAASKLFSKKRLRNSAFVAKTLQVPEELAEVEAEEAENPTEDATGRSGSRPRKRKFGEAAMEREEVERTVFVGNVPLNATQKNVKKLFADCGKIESVRLRAAVAAKEKMTRKLAVIKRKFAETAKSMIAYVKFADESSVAAALRLNGIQLGENHLRVDRCGGDRKFDQKTTVFIGNIPFGCLDDEVRGFFGDCGRVDAVRIVRDRHTGCGKGFGFVHFAEASSVALALKLDAEPFLDRPIRVTRALKTNKQLEAKRGRDKMEQKRQRKRDVKETVYRRKTDQPKTAPTKSSKNAEKSQKLPKKVRKIIKKRHRHRDGGSLLK